MPDQLTGVVLAGGLSSRLGHDKAVLRLDDGRTADLLNRSVFLLESVCGRAVVVGRTAEGYTCFPDATPGNGPVGGIATALRCCDTACLVLSCDLPFMDEGVLNKLIKRHAVRPRVTIQTSYKQEDTGHVEALVSIYEPECLPYFEGCVQEKKLKISLVVPHDRQNYVLYAASDSLPFFNINYPADLEVARKVLSMLGR